MKFEVEMAHEIEEGIEVNLIVTGNHVAAEAGNRRGHIDTYTPNCDAYIEDVKVFTSRGVRLPESIEKRLVLDSYFLERVERLV